MKKSYSSLKTLALLILTTSLGSTEICQAQDARSDTYTSAARGQTRLVVQLGHSLEVSSAAYSPDGKHVLTGSADGSARLWEVETGREVRVFEGHSEGLKSVAYSPDSRRVLTGSLDMTARVWDVETGRELQVLRGHSGTVWSVVVRMTSKDAEEIHLAKAKPLVLRPRLINPSDVDDDELEKGVRLALREESEPMTRGAGSHEPRLVYLDDGELPSAVRSSGTFTVDGDRVQVNLSLRRGEQRVTLDVEGVKSDLPALSAKIVALIAERMKAFQ